jgi:hypothetical protein
MLIFLCLFIVASLELTSLCDTLSARGQSVNKKNIAAKIRQSGGIPKRAKTSRKNIITHTALAKICPENALSRKSSSGWF